MAEATTGYNDVKQAAFDVLLEMKYQNRREWTRHTLERLKRPVSNRNKEVETAIDELVQEQVVVAKRQMNEHGRPILYRPFLEAEPPPRTSATTDERREEDETQPQRDPLDRLVDQVTSMSESMALFGQTMAEVATVFEEGLCAVRERLTVIETQQATFKAELRSGFEETMEALTSSADESRTALQAAKDEILEQLTALAERQPSNLDAATLENFDARLSASEESVAQFNEARQKLEQMLKRSAG